MFDWDKAWKEATTFNNQKELTEPERFYMNDLVKKGFEVRYDEVRVYNGIDNCEPASVLRINLICIGRYPN